MNATATENLTVTINGNKFVAEPHVFVTCQSNEYHPLRGVYYQNREDAVRNAYCSNGVGMWVNTFNHEGAEYYMAGYTNVWN